MCNILRHVYNQENDYKIWLKYGSALCYFVGIEEIRIYTGILFKGLMTLKFDYGFDLCYFVRRVF